MEGQEENTMLVGETVQAPSLSVVIPAYNCQETLPRLIDELNDVLPSCSAAYEVILVNDGSKDGTWQTIQSLARRSPAVRGIDLMRNYGQHNALLAGIRAAHGDVVVTMDDDLQHPPAEIPRLLKALSPEYDVVYGTPVHEQHGLWRDLASRVTKMALQGAMGAETARSVSAFRAFRIGLREAFQRYSSPYVSVDVLLTWGTTRFTAIPTRHSERAAGQSSYTFRKLVRHALTMTTGFSAMPLQVASLVGFAFTLLGLALLIYVLARFFIGGGSVPGFPFLASTIAIFSGAQLFALGIIGEYLARIHFRTLERPVYVVRETAGTPPRDT